MGLWSRFLNLITFRGNQLRGPRPSFLLKGKTPVNDETSMQVSAFNRGVIYVSTQIAKLPWEVKDKTNAIMDGPISNLLNLAPNPEMNAFFFRLQAIQNAIVYGNAYAEIERRGDGTPIALWPIPTRDVEIKRTVRGQLVYRVFGQSTEGPDVYLQPRDMFHIKNFHTKDGVVGQGVVAYGAETLGISLAADRMASGIFNNGGIPSGVITMLGTMSEEAYQRLEKSWGEQSAGRKSGGTKILEEGAKYEPISTDPETLQFLESRQFSVLEIARFLGVPPTKLFDITAATYSNVENANLEVATDTLDAWAVNLEMEADVKILNYRFGGRFTELDLYAVFRGDMKTRADYFKALMGIGAMTPNQVRQREGMQGYPEGDKYYIATNNFTPVDRMNEVIDAQIAKGTQPAAAPPPDDSKKDQGDPNNELETAAIRFLSK